MARRLAITAAVVGTTWMAAAVRAADPVPPAAIAQELRQLANTGRVLMVAAHPDDENTQLLTYLARGRDLATAYLSLTRGDGGQNVLGPEFGDELGWIRTQELLAARRLDGATQFFTRARDFGFSKNPAETLRIWDRQAVLGDVVRVIRTFHPDVIITRFSPQQTNTHGHHTASAILALEAFKLAADPTAYPEQLKTLRPWQAKRILQNTGFPVGGNGSIHLSVAGQDPVLNLSYAEIAARSRAMHKSQGFGNYTARGNRPETFNLLAGDPVANDLFDGIDTTWSRVPEGARIGTLIADAQAKFDPHNPAASLPAIAAIQHAVRALPPGPFATEKLALLDRILQHCLGLTVDTTAAASTVVPGGTVTLDHRLASATPVKLLRITAGGTTDDTAADLAAPTSRSMTVRIPADHAVTQPYWLAQPAGTGLYTVADPDLIGRPENPPAVPVTFTFAVADTTFSVTTNPRIDVIAPVSLAFPFDVNLFRPGTPRPVKVVATPRTPNVAGVVRLTGPAGWTVEPSQQVMVNSAGPQSFAFTVTPPAQPTSADLAASVTVDGKTYDTGWKEIRYPHIPPLLLQPRATLRATCLDLATVGHAIGYLPGAGDSVADGLREMGYAVTLLDTADFDPAKLKQFDAVVVGVRAFNVRKDLADHAQALFDYAAAGGTLVEQYNRPETFKNPIAPYPLKLSADRITDETAALKFLAPDHPALNRPNKITPADFDGWVQERGIYFPSEWDDRWTPLLAGNDPGEPPLNGGLLVAAVGKGHVVYTGLVFFRQLPAGVPGAYRLFANLVSLGAQSEKH